MRAPSYPPPAPGPRVNRRAVASLIAPTLGWEKADDAVAAAAKVLDLPDQISVEAAHAILDVLASVPGIVGVTARFARTRADFARALGPLRDQEAPTSSRSPVTSDSALKPRPQAFPEAVTIPLDDVATLLAHTVGQEKSREAVRASARRLGLPEDRIGREQASQLFDDLARQDGIVGITARFGKARLILRFGT